jgi:hypothetical protein
MARKSSVGMEREMERENRGSARVTSGSKQEGATAGAGAAFRPRTLFLYRFRLPVSVQALCLRNQGYMV